MSMDTVLTKPDIEIDVSHIVTEDDAPVDNWKSEKQQRLLANGLYGNWERYQPLVAGVDIGVFDTPYTPPIVPDVLVSFDTKIADDWYEKRNRTYFIWEFGKPPDIVIEIVSNKEGGELSRKLTKYARIRVASYVVYDPQQLIQDSPVVVYELIRGAYRQRDDLELHWFGLGLTLWEGEFEGKTTTWLRWVDAEGNLLLTGDEQAKQANARAEQEAERANQEAARAEQAEAQAAALLKILREAGIDPDK